MPPPPPPHSHTGIRGQCPHGLKCWLYFPEDDCPFYRTTVFSHYAKGNCPSDDAALPTLCRADGADPEAGHPRCRRAAAPAYRCLPRPATAHLTGARRSLAPPRECAGCQQPSRPLLVTHV